MFSSFRDRVRMFGKKRQASRAIRRAAIDALTPPNIAFLRTTGYGSGKG
jgi:hypothetical protein